MMEKELMKAAVRYQAIYVPEAESGKGKRSVSESTMGLVANLRQLGYSVSEELLDALNTTQPTYKKLVLDTFKDVLGVNLNWASLVKGWNVPTGESFFDHIVTFFANVFQIEKGTRLPCGHIIPEGTFALERYNGCPYCGTPFEFGRIENYGQGSKLKELTLWTQADAEKILCDLLESKTALDATQADTLKTLLSVLPVPDAEVSMKETKMMMIDAYIAKGQDDKAAFAFSTPDDILRYLWYKKTGFLQLIEPKTLIKRAGQAQRHITRSLDKQQQGIEAKKNELKLKYTRQECRRVATWLNSLGMDTRKACEIMHPKRSMWVRFIRALRLAEYANRKGFENLRELMEVFYNQTYTVAQGDIDRARLKGDADAAFKVLKQRPGLFARSLFTSMLWFGPKETIAAFEEVMDKVPARLIFTLNMYAADYFNPKQERVVKPLGGNTKRIPVNQLVEVFTDDQLQEMVDAVKALCTEVIRRRFARIPNENKTIYIEPALFRIPLAIGDRSDTVQDISAALQGTRFAVEGDAVRLFMQWGKGLPAQHLDMDLSASIIMQNSSEVCSYYSLSPDGARHSGDVRSIPDRIGTAEYIELNLPELARIGTDYVMFTCNSYSNGALSPNLVVGWMNSANSITISPTTGVAYDPSCVQHQVRITQSLSKGLVFGVLDVKNREITWLEMPFQGQIVGQLNTKTVEALLSKLQSKATIGELLAAKAEAQGLELTETPEADEVYTMEWALNTAAVTRLMVD